MAAAAGFLLLLGAAAFAVVRYGRQWAPLHRVTGSMTRAVRVLEIKRAGPRLRIITVQVDDNSRIVFADNGSALLLLHRDSETGTNAPNDGGLPPGENSK